MPLKNVTNAAGFIPSMLGLAAGLIAPQSIEETCGVAAPSYGIGQNPFRHDACHDPRRFTVFAFEATTDGGGLLTVAAATAQNDELELFLNGVGETDAEAGMTSFGAKTPALTNVEKGGYLVPPGYEGLVSAIGFQPIGAFLKASAPGLKPIAAGHFGYEGVWEALFRACSVKVSYWEAQNKYDRDIGTMERWPCPDAISGPNGTLNGPEGSILRLNPLQYQIPTLGPAERRGDERADRLSIKVKLEHELTSIPSSGTAFTASQTLLLLVRCEMAVGLMDDVQIARDNAQDSKLAQLEAKIARLEGRG